MTIRKAIQEHGKATAGGIAGIGGTIVAYQLYEILGQLQHIARILDALAGVYLGKIIP